MKFSTTTVARLAAAALWACSAVAAADDFSGPQGPGTLAPITAGALLCNLTDNAASPTACTELPAAVTSIATGATAARGLAAHFGDALTPQDFGAACDVVIVSTNGSMTSGSSTFTAPSSLPSSAAGKRIAIFGAGTSNATLFGVIANNFAGGTSVAITTNGTTALTAGTTVPAWAPTTQSIAAGGSGYVLDDTVTDSNGLVFTVTKVSGGAVSDVAITTQTTTSGASAPSNPRTQSSTSGVGTGAQFTVTYQATGKFAYGTDDATALQAWLTYGQSVGATLTIPRGTICGTTVKLTMPNDGVVVRGAGRGGNASGQSGSGIVALAGSLGAVIEWDDAGGVGGRGGGAENLFVDAFRGATDTCRMEAGKRRVFRGVRCLNGTNSAWFYGTSSSIGDNYWYDSEGLVNTTFFPLATAQKANYGFYADSPDSRIFGGLFGGNATKAVVSNAFNNEFHGVTTLGSAPFQPTYCFEFSLANKIYGGQCSNPLTAGVHLSGAGSSIFGLELQGNNGFTKNAKGVALDSGVSYTHVSGVTSDNFYGGDRIAAANVIVQSGSVGAGNELSSPNSSYSQYGPIGLLGSTSGLLTVKAPAVAGTNTLTLPAGTTDFSATGGSGHVVQQASAGAALTVGALSCASLSDESAMCASASASNLSSGTLPVARFPGGTMPPSSICLNCTGASTTWTDMPSAETFFNGANRGSTGVDLTNYTQVRLKVTMLGTGCVSGGVITLKYKTGNTWTNVASFSTIGASAVTAACDVTSTISDSGWINLVAGAKADVSIAISGTGGDGVVDPTFGNINAQFR